MRVQPFPPRVCSCRKQKPAGVVPPQSAEVRHVSVRQQLRWITAWVDVLMCAGCGLCEQICEYRALRIDPYRKVMTVNEALCKGCGACNATCPSSAISLRHFKTEQIIAQLREVC